MDCLKCGHTWAARTLKPVCCPRCKRYNYHQKSNLPVNFEPVQYGKTAKVADRPPELALELGPEEGEFVETREIVYDFGT